MRHLIILSALAMTACGPAVGVDAARQAGAFSSVYWNPANWDWAGGAAVMGAYAATQAYQPVYVQQPVYQPPTTCFASANGRMATCY